MTDKTKHILFLNRGSVLYGAETRMLDILRNLKREEFTPLVMLPNPGPLSETLKEMGVEVIFLDFVLGPNPSLKAIYKLNSAMIDVIRKYHIDILHFNMHFGISNLWPVLLKMHRRTVVHLRSHFWIYPFERFCIYRCAKIICVSDHVRHDFLKKRRSDLLTFIRKDRVVTIYDGIDVNSFKPVPADQDMRREFQALEQTKLVAVIGALHPVKGQDIVVEAAPLIFKEHPQAKIIFIGGVYLNNTFSMNYHAKLISRIDELGLNEKVLLVGPRKDIPMVMNAIDILLQPSEREALGTSMVEAMSCEKPVIGTMIDGIPEVIGPDVAGFLLKDRTGEALAVLVNKLLSDPKLSLEKGANGRKRVLEQFNIQKTITLLSQIYRNL